MFTIHSKLVALAFLAACNAAVLTALSESASAQSAVTLTSEGISGDLDSKRRSPSLSVTPVVEGERVKLLVDAYVAHVEYQHLPIQFDFFINRHFFTSQIRSKELPGPIGIEIGPQTAALPFNYTVIAKLLHPNREFTTVINGAVFSSNLSGTLDCTLTTGLNGDNSVEFVANSISTAQSSNNSFSISFDADSVTGGHEVVFSSTINVNGDEAQAALSIAQNGAPAAIVQSEGEVEVDDGALQSISLSSTDGDVALECS
ncbi:MAG: hypothetical protein J5J00_12630 [Deltaproteobacteria bacterium]|nr:hypothetical protein [Deltaproteobacteria bacterium]